jgi:hypothetical protein
VEKVAIERKAMVECGGARSSRDAVVARAKGYSQVALSARA